VRGVSGEVISYTYRLFVMAPGVSAPVLAFNHELSMLGTCCFGSHEATGHTNWGAAPESILYDEFREKALAMVTERLSAR
jgi:hypothetical protein